MPFARRDDVPVKEVAERWIDGETVLDLAAAYDTTHTLIQRRVARARKLHPDLAWHKRDKEVTSPAGYVHMTDGKAGQSTPRAGSFVNGRPRR